MPEEVALFIEALQPLLSPENSSRISWTVRSISTAPLTTPLDLVIRDILRQQVRGARRRLRGIDQVRLGTVDPKARARRQVCAGRLSAS